MLIYKLIQFSNKAVFWVPHLFKAGGKRHKFILFYFFLIGSHLIVMSAVIGILQFRIFSPDVLI